MEEKEVSLETQLPIRLDIAMYKKGLYRETDKMSDLICENYPMVLVMSRFGIALGFGEKSIGEVNFLTGEVQGLTDEISRALSLETLIRYLHNAHDYFLAFRLPNMRRKLNEAISICPEDVAFVIRRFFDEYAEEVNKHMTYEEKVVFPYVRDLLNGKVSDKYNISIFRKRHEQIDQKLSDLKNILIKYYPGEGGHLLNSVLFDLFTTEEDLVSHSLVEDNLFVPSIVWYENKMLNR